jgi:hypothetical protein
MMMLVLLTGEVMMYVATLTSVVAVSFLDSWDSMFARCFKVRMSGKFPGLGSFASGNRDIVSAMSHIAFAPTTVSCVIAAPITLSDIAVVTIASYVMATTAIPNLIATSAIGPTRIIGTAKATTAGWDKDHGATTTIRTPAPSCLSRGRSV